MRFPMLRAENLMRQEVSLPQDFAGQANVVLIAFQQIHQIQVNSWLPCLTGLEREFPDLDHYELPTIRSSYRLGRGIIDGGMRAGIPDPATRRRTITLYLDKDAFRRTLNIEQEDDITVLLLDVAGEIIWRSDGDCDETKTSSLRHAVAQYLGD